MDESGNIIHRQEEIWQELPNIPPPKRVPTDQGKVKVTKEIQVRRDVHSHLFSIIIPRRHQFLLIILTCAVSFPLIAYTETRGFVLPVSMGETVSSTTSSKTLGGGSETGYFDRIPPKSRGQQK